MPISHYLDIQKDILVQKYVIERMPIKRVAEYIGTDRNTIRRYLRKHNIPLRKNPCRYCFDEFFFETPNILNSYWAGFIAADGCIANKKSVGCCNYLSIGLSVKDKEFLERFKNDIKFEGPITVDKKNICKLRLFSQKLCDDLYKNFNITQRKTYTLQPPNGLTDDQIMAFITGYIDGDGCITLIENMPNISLVGNKQVLEWTKINLIRILKLEWTVGLHFQKKLKYGNELFILQIYSIHDVLKVYYKVKKLSIMVMDRKWDRITNVIENNIDRIQKCFRRKGIFLTYDNKKQSINKWSKDIGIGRGTLRKRYDLGWSDEKILTTPIGKRNASEN